MQQPPITIFLTAKAVRKILSLRVLYPQHFLYFSIQEGGCRDYFYDFALVNSSQSCDDLNPLLYSAETWTPIDVWSQIPPVILIEKKMYPLFQDVVLDFLENFMEESFEIIHNPQVAKNCSCNQSFDLVGPLKGSSS